MKIIRTINSQDPNKCSMIAKGFFGNVLGEVKYANYGIEMLNGNTGYFVLVRGQLTGAATNFDAACNALLEDLNVVKTVVA